MTGLKEVLKFFWSYLGFLSPAELLNSFHIFTRDSHSFIKTFSVFKLNFCSPPPLSRHLYGFINTKMASVLSSRSPPPLKCLSGRYHRYLKARSCLISKLDFIIDVRSGLHCYLLKLVSLGFLELNTTRRRSSKYLKILLSFLISIFTCNSAMNKIFIANIKRHLFN